MGFQVSSQTELDSHQYYKYVDAIDKVKDIISSIENTNILTDFERGVWVMEVMLVFLYETKPIRDKCKLTIVPKLDELIKQMNEFVNECKLSIGARISELFKTYGTVREYLFHRSRIEILEKYKMILI